MGSGSQDAHPLKALKLKTKGSFLPQLFYVMSAADFPLSIDDFRNLETLVDFPPKR
jgi:hypothetical protein